MASSATEICNRALNRLSIGEIDSLEEQTKAGRICKRLYPQLRDELTREHPWPFAKMRVSLPALATAPAFGYANAFQLPGDQLRVLAIGWAATDPEWQPGPGRHDGPEFRIEGGSILTDEPAPLPVLYLRQVTNPGLFDALFSGALVRALARDMCMPLKQDRALFNDLMNEAQAALSKARGVANLESGSRPLLPSRILDIRL